MIPSWVTIGIAAAVGKAVRWVGTPSRAQREEELQAIDRRNAERNEARRRADAIDKARRFCDACKTELGSPEVSYCPRCGNSRIVTRGQILELEQEKQRSNERKQLEKQARIQAEEASRASQEQQRKQMEIHRDAARRGCRDIASWKYCARCGCERQPSDKFCIKCGDALESMPLTAAFERAQKEFPDCVRTKDDFNGFVKWSQRLR
jgi:hypothetical protein